MMRQHEAGQDEKEFDRCWTIQQAEPEPAVKRVIRRAPSEDTAADRIQGEREVPTNDDQGGQTTQRLQSGLHALQRYGCRPGILMLIRRRLQNRFGVGLSRAVPTTASVPDGTALHRPPHAARRAIFAGACAGLPPSEMMDGPK
jgi:hypothetical protein